MMIHCSSRLKVSGQSLMSESPHFFLLGKCQVKVFSIQPRLLLIFITVC